MRYLLNSPTKIAIFVKGENIKVDTTLIAKSIQKG